MKKNRKLPRQYSNESTCIKQSVIQGITDDGDLPFLRILKNQEYTIELLLDIADMCVTIRGFSLASS